MTNEELIERLIDSAHATGYYLNKKDCKELHDEALAKLNEARRAIFERLIPVERLRRYIDDLESSVACDQVTIADLEARIRRLEETGIAFMEELKEAA